jgi:hypothetical protein
MFAATGLSIMSAKEKQVNLSEQRQAGVFKCWRKTIGGRAFYFTRDRGQSERMARALMAAWEQLVATGGCWSDETIAAALSLVGGKRNSNTARTPAHVTAVHDAVADYLADYRKLVSEGRYFRHAAALAAYKRQQPNVQLRRIGADEIRATVAHFRARPQTSRGAPMAVASVQTTLKAVRAFLDWCDLTDRWQAPRRFERLFRVNYAALRTPAEIKRDGEGTVVFTVAELTTLWSAATSRQRLYFGLALNIGETAQGLAHLMKSDIRRDGGQLIIDRHRHKTAVRGVYPLWVELSRLVETEMDRDTAEALAFKTGDGKPLVWYHDTGRVDSISKTWANLMDKCTSVRRLGFSALRKTGATLVRELTGSVETAQVYLSHKGASVAEKHYLAASFVRLADALVAMRQLLDPVFALSTASPRCPATSPSAAEGTTGCPTQDGDPDIICAA